MKVIVIGCTHAGTAAIVNIKKFHEDVSVTVYERNDNISFLSCGIALYVGGVVKEPKDLFYSSPKALAELGVTTKMCHDVLNVDLEQKTVLVKNLETGEEFSDSYDKLVVTTGSWPIVPPFPGVNLENILLCKNYSHAKQIIEQSKDAKNVVVVGGGYIGIELLEAFEQNGKSVTLIDLEKRILSKYIDAQFTDLVEDEFKQRGVKFALGEKVVEFKGDGKVSAVVTDKGEYSTDLVILCIGFKPNTGLFAGKLDMLGNGAIIVDEYMRTSHKDVFAAGDSAAIFYNPTQKAEYIPLATNAVRMGTLVAVNLKEQKIKYMGTQATSGIKIYDYCIAATGLTETAAADKGISVKSVCLTDNYRPEFMPSYDPATVKVVYHSETKEILGAQICAKADYTQLMNLVSVCIQKKMTITELAFVDQFFQPHFNKPWNLINSVGLKSLE